MGDGCSTILGYLAMGFLCFMGGCKAGFMLGDSYWKPEAYRRGAATWEVSDDGSTTFKWILEPESEGE